jgi:hypothetical protein
MPGSEHSQWEELYRAALLELDVSRLAARIDLAEAAIQKRLQELKSSPDNAREQQAIQDAVQTLRALRRSTKIK